MFLPEDFNAIHLDELDGKRRRKQAIKKKRLAVYLKFGGRCAYCNRPLTFDGENLDERMTEDHIIPKRPQRPVKRPDDISAFRNIACCCKSCNRSKGNENVWDWWQTTGHWNLERAKFLHDHMHDNY